MRISDWSSDVCSSDLLAGACDIRIAARSAVLTSEFVKVGLSGDMGGTWFWSRILGAGKARRLYLLSESFDSAAAKEFGLFDEVVEDDAHAGTVEALSRSLANGSALTYRYAKEARPADGSTNHKHILTLQ